jgi:hypothetical protein
MQAAQSLKKRGAQLGNKNSKKHGMRRTFTYNSWESMKKRCNNKNHIHYDKYGGRGITICNEWDDFVNFYKDMGERPSKKHTLDRIDPNGNYELNNCRWVTWSTQRINQRPRGKSKFNGVATNNSISKKWRSFIRVNGKQEFLGTFKTEIEAARAFNHAAIKHYGNEYLRLNKIGMNE